MSKKPRKPSTAGQNRWEPALMSCPFEDDNWKVNIQFMMENDVLDEHHIKALSNVVKIPQRRLFSFLHKNDLLEMVSELGNPKNKKPAKMPPFYEVTEIVFGLLNANQDIPLPLWAKLIKFGLLNIKDEAMKKKEHDSKLKDDKEKHGKGSGKKRPRSKSPGKKGKKTPEPHLPKKDWSTLKKRGEEDDLNKYIDDEPDDGPQHYILVGGFKKPQLLVILGELGINVNGVIKVKSESYDFLAKMSDEKVGAEGHDEEALAQIHFHRELEVKELAVFWKLLPVLLQSAPPTSKIQDLGVHQYTVREQMYPTDWENQENMVGYGTALFEDIACKIYDSLDWQRQYLNYLKNVSLVHVPEFGKADKSSFEGRGTPLPPLAVSPSGKRGERSKVVLEPPSQTVAEELVPPISTPSQATVDTRYYQDLMNCVPMESVSVNLVMHCMLEQVEATEKDKIPPSEVEQRGRDDGIHMALAECIADSMQGLSLTEEDEQILSNDFPQYKQKKDEKLAKNITPSGPVLLHYGDDMSVRTHHLKEIDNFSPKDVEMALTNHLPSASLLKFPTPPLHVACERASRLHELHRYTTTGGESGESAGVVSGNDVDQALQLFEFENMIVSAVDGQGVVRKPPDNCENIWDDPYTAAAKNAIDDGDLMLKNGQEKGATEERGKEAAKTSKSLESYFEPIRRLDNYTYSETFKAPVLLQMLDEARHTYPCMDTYYSKRNNSTLVMFHYPMSDGLKSISSWSASLHSDVGFRNYLEHVAGPIARWTKVEEQKYHAETIAKELELVKQQQEVHATAEQPSTPPPTGKRPKSKTSRRGSPSRSSSKAGTTEDSHHFSSPFIRPGSIKAENEIQSKLKEDEDKEKSAKKNKEARKSADKNKGRKSAASKSSAKLESKPSSSTGKRPKSGGRRSKARSRSSSQDRLEDKPPVETELPKMPDLPFIGYDVGNNLIHADGNISHLYPCDGGTIKVEKVNYKQGQTSVKTTLYKDGHVFVLHVLEPMNPEEEAKLLDLLTFQTEKKPNENLEKGDTEPLEKDGHLPRLSSCDLTNTKAEDEHKYHSLFTSWSATLCDGMTMAFSSNGPEGVSAAAVQAKETFAKILSDIPPASSPTPLPPGAETPTKKGGRKSPKGGKSPRSKSPRGGKKVKESERELEVQRLEEQRIQEELERKLSETREAEELERRKRMIPKFPQLFTSCPDGLSIRYEVDPSSAVTNSDTGDVEFKLMVRQNYRYKTSGKQATEKLRAKPAMEEVSRLVLADGRVIKVMKDGSTKILLSDGTVCDNAGCGPIVTDQRIPVTPNSLPSGASNPQVIADDQGTTMSAGSKKGSKGRRSSGKTLPEATVTEPSVAGTLGHSAAGLEADAGARLEAEQENAGTWLTTYISGEVTLTKLDGTVVSQEPLLCYSATDPVSGEVLHSREDKVIRVDRPDGSSICDHTDGTRITRYCREEEGEDQDKVWFVRVECPGFVTVTFNQSDASCTTLFGSGSTLTTHIDGTYQLSHWNGGRVDISSDGNVVYTPQPNNDLLIAALSTAEDAEDEERIPLPQSDPLGSYMMRQSSNVCCEALDQEGNVFQVKTTGDINVITTNHLVHSEEGEGENDVKPFKIDPMEHHPPRLFIVRNDGTGTELLRYKDVQDYVSDAQLDPVTAIIREPLPENIKVTGITVMRPHFGNSGDAWVLQKEEQDIIPTNLKTRDLELLPSNEKKPGPPFATTVGKGLAVGSAPPVLSPPPAPACPSALELRQLVQHQPISQGMRQHLATKLMAYGQAVCEQEFQRDARKVNEPRTAEEQMKARDLLRLVLEFDDEVTPRSPETTAPFPSGGVPGQAGSSTKFPCEVPDEQNSEIVKMKYEAAVAPPPLPVAPPPKNKLTQADWDRIHRSIQEDKELRKTLKKLDVPAYFDSDQGKAWLLSQATDMKSAARQLSTDPRTDGTEARMYETQQKAEERGRLNSSTSPSAQDVSSGTSLSRRESGGGAVSDTPSKVRPTNPTPAHASGGGTPTKVRPDNPTPISAREQQPRNARPSNPTPSHASSGASHKHQEPIAIQMAQQYQPSPIPENPTSAQRRETESHLTPTQSNLTAGLSEGSRNSGVLPLETEPSDLILTRSLLYDVTGKPRKERVRLPTSILSDKPGAVPNEKFIRVEEEVRRKVRTSSVAGGLSQNHLRVDERGFQFLPPEVVFGVLREGTTYCYTVRMRNVGVDLCRYKIKQPPPGTGIRVHYTPGPVAAGMETKLDLEIYAVAVGVEGDSGVGTINHQLEIVTETDIIHLPVTAIVLPAFNYDNRTDGMPGGEKAPGVKISSNKPPSRDVILRPHKTPSD